MPTASLPVSRRRCLLAPAAAWLVGLVGCSGAAIRTTTSTLPAANAAAAGPGAAAAAPAAAPAIPLQQVGPGVYLLQGAAGEMDQDNAGRVGNAGFIVGPGGVLVIDSGSAWQHGRALLAAVRSVTALPVRLALLTHARQEFVFGASALQAERIPVAMTRRNAQLMAARCEGCLKALQRVLGADVMRHTTLAKPDLLLDDPVDAPPEAVRALLQAIGRPLRLISHGHSSGPGDLAVLDEPSGLLFTGGLCDVRRIPDIQDADLAGWQKALQSLRALPIRGVVPGHGPVGPPEALDLVARYLRELDVRTGALAQQGLALSEVPDAANLPGFADWDQTDTIHRRNASILFLRHERRLLHD